MTWTPVAEQLPKDYINLLITVKEKKTGKRYVMSCVWSSVIDLETGEIIGPPTFADLISEDGRMIFVDYQKNKSIEILAWMPYPSPYEDQFRVIVAGSRSFNDYALLKDKLDKAFLKHKPTSIVCGEASGADTLGRRYAEENGIKIDSFPADWNTHGKQAGYIRNEEMAGNADALIAFHVNNSAGTRHMINTAKKMGLQVRVINI